MAEMLTQSEMDWAKNAPTHNTRKTFAAKQLKKGTKKTQEKSGERIEWKKKRQY